MKTIGSYTVYLPDYALSYLVNDDSSGIEEEDKKTIDSYMEFFYHEAKINNGSVIIDTTSNESFFTWSPAFGLACNCFKASIIILK